MAFLLFGLAIMVLGKYLPSSPVFNLLILKQATTKEEGYQASDNTETDWVGEIGIAYSVDLSGTGGVGPYTFEVTGGMLNPETIDQQGVSGTQAAGSFYTTADLGLTGTYQPGDVWTLELNGNTYTYTAGQPVPGYTADLSAAAMEGVATGLLHALL